MEDSETTQRVARVAFAGELDVALEHQIVDRIESAAGPRCTQVVVDLVAVTFCDSSALRALLTAQARLARDDIEMVLGDVSDQVTRVLELSGAAELFNRRA